MINYINSMIEEFPYELESKFKCAWTEKLFNVDTSLQKVDKTKSDTFHTFVMKCMFLGKRGRPDILTGTSFLSTRVRESNTGDWKKLIRQLSYIKESKNIRLNLEADGT